MLGNRGSLAPSQTASDVKKQYCFVSDAWRKYLRFVRESIYSEKRWLQISTNCCATENETRGKVRASLCQWNGTSVFTAAKRKPR